MKGVGGSDEDRALLFLLPSPFFFPPLSSFPAFCLAYSHPIFCSLPISIFGPSTFSLLSSLLLPLALFPLAPWEAASCFCLPRWVQSAALHSCCQTWGLQATASAVTGETAFGLISTLGLPRGFLGTLWCPPLLLSDGEGVGGLLKERGPFSW